MENVNKVIKVIKGQNTEARFTHAWVWLLQSEMLALPILSFALYLILGTWSGLVTYTGHHNNHILVPDYLVSFYLVSENSVSVLSVCDYSISVFKYK